MKKQILILFSIILFSLTLISPVYGHSDIHQITGGGSGGGTWRTSTEEEPEETAFMEETPAKIIVTLIGFTILIIAVLSVLMYLSISIYKYIKKKRE